jgi:hypothetical protein
VLAYRLPGPYSGLQVNVCKNPHCASFGVPETPYTLRRVPGSPPVPGAYSRYGAKSSAPSFTCPCCGQHPPLRSNQAIHEEYQRLAAYLADQSDPACPNDACASHGVTLSDAPGSYAKFGTTAGGSIRWKCKTCGKVFTQGAKATKRQLITHRNKDVFSLLVNKMPMRRICEVTGLGPQVLYDKFNWIHRQCQLFVGERERRLLTGSVTVPTLYVAIDRQQYIVNWSKRKDKRNVMLAAIASAELKSGYVFGFQLNFDGDADPSQVEADAAAIGDAALSPAYRKYARLWIQADYAAASASSKLNARKVARALKKARTSNEVEGEIDGRYDENLIRQDIEVNEDGAAELKLPDSGMQVHEQYTIYAHFLLLKQLSAHAPKIRLFLDQDPGFRAAFMALFADRIKDRTADGFFVSVLKDATNDEKEKLVAQSKARLSAMQAVYPALTKHQIEIELVKQAIASAQTKGQWGDTWIEHPFPNKAEPEKRVCWLTNMGDYTPDHAASLYLKASLHAVDRFFMRARRMLSLAERPIASASAARRTWYGYSPYNPAHLARQLEIFRVHYNYCVKGQDGKTPAMRLGLARGPVELEKILAFDPMAKHRCSPKPSQKAERDKKSRPDTDWLSPEDELII